MSGVAQLRAYQQGGPVRDKLKQLWEGIRSKADDPSLGYIGASMLPGVGEATDLVEIGAGLQDRSPGRVGLGIAGLMLPFVGAAGLKKIGKQVAKPKRPKRLQSGPPWKEVTTPQQRQKLREFIAEEAGGDVKDVNKNIEVIKARLRETPETRRKRIAQEMIARVRPEDRMPFTSIEMRAARRLAPNLEDLSPAQIEDISKLPRDERWKALGYGGYHGTVPGNVFHGTRHNLEGSHLKVFTDDDPIHNWGRGQLGQGIYTHQDPWVANYFSSDPMSDYMLYSRGSKWPTEFGEPTPWGKGMVRFGHPSFKTNWSPQELLEAQGSQVMPLMVRPSRLLNVRRHNTPQRIYSEIETLKEKGKLTDKEILEKVMPTPFDEMIVDLDRQGEWVHGFDRLSGEGARLGAHEHAGLNRLAQGLGYEGLSVHTDATGLITDNPWLPNEVLTFAPGAGLRSKFAGFDPYKLHSRDLMAGIGGLTGARYMSNALREDQS